MATINNFEDLKVWQKARILCQEVFELIEKEKFCRDYKLKDQINGSSGSVMDNIAEGFGRQGNNEFINFLTISNGSGGKVSTLPGTGQKIYKRNQICRTTKTY
jgi:four helix bundle protein